MKKKQSYNPLIDPDSKEFVAPNRKTFRAMSNETYQPKRLEQTPRVNKVKSELSQFKKDLAREFGSKTGRLKRKHINRQRLQQLQEAK